MSTSSPSPAIRMALWPALVFAAIGLPIHAINLAATVYLPHHYASHLDISLAAVGSAFFLVRMIDIPVEFLLGWGIDRTRTRWGRCRPWIVAGAPIFMLGVWMAFVPAAGAGRWYIVLWMLVLYLGHSTLTLAQLTWASALAPSYDARSRLFGILAAVGIVGAGSIIAIPIINAQIGAADGNDVPTMAWFILGSVPPTLALLLWLVPEPVVVGRGDGGLGYRDMFALLKQPNFARLLLADVVISLGISWVGAIYLFYFTDGRGFTTAQASILLAIYILAGIVGAPAMARVAIRTSKHRALIAGCLIYAAIFIILPFLPRGNLFAHAVLLFVAGGMGASFNSITRAMTADIADEVRLQMGQERAGLLYAMTTMTNKVTAAIAVGITFFLLSKVGYVAGKGVVNSPEAIQGLESVYLGGSIAFVAVGAICMIGYKLDAARHAEIRRELDRRDASFAPD